MTNSIQKQATFKQDGTIECRGEHAFSYKAGEAVTILDEQADGTLQIVVSEGEGKGTLVYLDKEILNIS